jgi:nanoRNase/pAp phosphatase (c-di-AMP/oligoRNAs hydrolase)
LEVFVYDHHPPSDEDIPALPDHCLVKPLGSCTALLLHELVKKIKGSSDVNSFPCSCVHGQPLNDDMSRCVVS